MMHNVVEKHGAVEHHARGIDDHTIAEGNFQLFPRSSSQEAARCDLASAEVRSSSESR